MDYNIMRSVGTVKYLVNFYSGKTNPYGSKLYDIKTFKSKAKMKSFINDLIIKGYKEA